MGSGDRQIDYLTETIARIEEQMAEQISPQEFGELKGTVKAVDSKVGDLEEKVEKLAMKVDNLIEIVTEARGGWRTVVWLGSVSATLGGAIVGAIGWAMNHVQLK